MQTVLVRASVLTKVYLANVVVLDVLSNPSDGSRTRRVVEVVELAVFAATVVVHVLTRYFDVSVCSRSSVRVVLPIPRFSVEAMALPGGTEVV